jgi:hypothetical protein
VAAPLSAANSTSRSEAMSRYGLGYSATSPPRILLACQEAERAPRRAPALLEDGDVAPITAMACSRSLPWCRRLHTRMMSDRASMQPVPGGARRPERPVQQVSALKQAISARNARLRQDEPTPPDPTPAKTLRGCLSDSKVAQAPFETAWRRGVKAALRETEGASDAARWKEAFKETKKHWRAAYHNQPASPRGDLQMLEAAA